MTTNTECNVQYIPYKEFIKQKRLEYYNKNKEEIKQKARDKCNSLTSEEKKKRQEYKKEWYKNLPEYQKIRYHNSMSAVKIN